MNNSYKILQLILLLIISRGICYGKNFIVTEIVYLPTDRSATESPVKDNNEETCALIKLPFPNVDEKVISGDQIFKKEYHGNEWYIYMPPNTYKFYIKYPGYDDLEIDLSQQFPNGVESGKTYKVTIPYNKSEVIPAISTIINDRYTTIDNTNSIVNSNFYPSVTSQSFSNIKTKKENLIKKNSFYLEAGYNILGLSGLSVGIGAYISNFNIEADYLFGLSKSENIYWNNTSGEDMPILATYSPMGFNLKIGYGIKLSRQFRITPRLGIQYVVLQEKSSTKVANNANALGVPIGVKIDFAIVNHFGISFEPSYLVNVSKSEGYKTLSDISDKIKGYADGIGLNISLYCNF